MIRPTGDMTKLRTVLAVETVPRRPYANSSMVSSGPQKAVLLVLWSIEGQRTSVRGVADLACIHEWQAGASIKLLIEQGLITRHGKNGPAGSTYTINLKPCRDQRQAPLDLVLPHGNQNTTPIDSKPGA